MVYLLPSGHLAWTHGSNGVQVENSDLKSGDGYTRRSYGGEGRGRGSSRGGRTSTGKGRGHGRDMYLSNAPAGADRGGKQSQDGLEFSQASMQDNYLPPETAQQEPMRAADSAAPVHGSGRVSSAGPSAGREVTVTPEDLYAQAEDARGRGGGRRSRPTAGAGQHRQTFYGREVSMAQAAGHQATRPGRSTAGHGMAQDPGVTAAPAGSRRYLANRGDAAPGASGQASDGAATMAVAPSMVPVHDVDNDPQNVHFNPNAPGFLPMGGEGGDVGTVMPGAPAMHAVAGVVPPDRAPGTQRPHSQGLPYSRRATCTVNRSRSFHHAHLLQDPSMKEAPSSMLHGICLPQQRKV